MRRCWPAPHLHPLTSLPIASSKVGGSPEELSRLDVSFAGIQFTFVGPAALLTRIESTPRVLVLRDSAPSAEARPFAKVWCRVRPASLPGATGAPPAFGGRAVEWQWRGDSGHVRTQHAQAHWQLGPNGASAEATLGPSRRAAEGLLVALTGALLHRAGGALIHSASVEQPDGVIAFVGPSGAGKSTACEHVEGALQFSFDRLAVVPVGGDLGRRAWRAYPLPGGTPPTSNTPEPGSHGRPLKAILRIRQAAHGCWLEECSTSQAVALLRESAFHTNQGPAAELGLLALLEQLAIEAPIANLHFSLGTSLGPAVSRWLTEKCSARERARSMGKER
jgi:hypothetical protein